MYGPPPPTTRSPCVTSRSQHTLAGPSWGHMAAVFCSSYRGEVGSMSPPLTVSPGLQDVTVIMSSSRGRRLQEVQLLPSSGKVPASTCGAPPDDMMTALGTRGARMTASAGARASGVRPSSALRHQACRRMNDGRRRREPRP